MRPFANYLYALAYSDVYSDREWKKWADQLLTDAEFDADTEWVFDVAFAHDIETLFQVISERKNFEKYGSSERYPLTEIIQGFYYLQYISKTITLYELLEKSGDVADAGSDSEIPCEFFYNLLNQIDADSNIVNTETFSNGILEYFQPRYMAAMEQKEKLESATVEDMKFEAIRDAVEEFIETIIRQEKYPNCKFDILKNEIDCYRVIVEFENCMGKIIVNRPDFAPYRFVWMEVLSSKCAEYEQVFVWSDNESDCVEDVIYRIGDGLKIVSQYNNFSEKSS